MLRKSRNHTWKVYMKPFLIFTKKYCVAKPNEENNAPVFKNFHLGSVFISTLLYSSYIPSLVGFCIVHDLAWNAVTTPEMPHLGEQCLCRVGKVTCTQILSTSPTPAPVQPVHHYQPAFDQTWFGLSATENRDHHGHWTLKPFLPPKLKVKKCVWTVR